MADDTFGLTPSGFVPMQLSDVQDELQAQMQLQFGNVDLSDQSVFGQLIGIMSASSAQLWQAGSALYAATFPGGASGVAVDNILALANMTRLPEEATVTNPTPVTQSNGLVLYGLRLLGTPNTTVPAGTLLNNGAASPVTFATDAAVTIGGANNAQQVVYFGNTPNRGAYTFTLTAPSGVSLTTPIIAYNNASRVTVLTWAAPPTGTYTITLDPQNTTAAISGQASSSQVQAAINALPGYGSVAVSGNLGAGLRITWPAGYVPTITAAGAGAPSNIAHATAAMVHALSSGGVQPFTDVLLTDGPQTIQFDFGAFAPQNNQPSTAGVAIARIAANAPSLANSTSYTYVAPKIVVLGNPAQAIASATATTPGPQTVVAGQLTTIVTPVSGLSGAINDLDCLTGRNVESDADAITRFNAQLGSTASGSLGAITKRVSGVDGVTQVVSFQNTGNAAGQVVLFATPPTAGAFSLLIGGQTTPTLPYNATAGAVQAAVRGLTGFGAVNVTAYGSNGYQFDFAGVRGNQALPLMSVASNTTQVALTPYYGRPPHSVEVVVEGGSDSDVAAAILASLPAGVATYSNPSQRTTATLTQGQAQATLADATNVSVGQTVEASGVPLGTTVAALTSNTLTLSAAATASGSGVPIAFTSSPLLKDAAGNVLSIGFSRPQSVLIYVQLNIVTDTFVSPGDNTSGLNSGAQWNPANVSTIAQSLINLINAVPIGGTIVANGTNSLGGSFRQTPGVVSYSLAFGTTPNPTSTGNLSLQSNQAPTAQSYSVAVTYA